jgi:MoaA/NifB/PqqE/SkfB family radical SAM enzyme
MLTNLALIATTRCDLQCQHCLRGYPTQRSDFPVELLDKLLTEAMPFGVKHVGLTGGEPHLHPQFEQIVEEIVSYGYTWHFVSHGQRTEPYLPVMERYRDSFKHISLSIDGAKAETHDEIRGRKGAFEKVTAAARLYVEKEYHVQISVTLNQKNKGQVEEFVKLAEELHVAQISFGGIIPAPWNEHLVLSDSESLELYQQIEALRPCEFLGRTTSSLYTRGGVNFCNNYNLVELTINTNGDLIFCCDTVEGGAVTGSLREHSLAVLIEMWLEQANTLRHERVKHIANGAMGDGFDTCNFCNQYFSR